MKTITVKWTGIRPVLMHNGILCDPTNKYVRDIKAITSKGSKKMTDHDYERRDSLEWEGSLYWHSKMGLVFPSDNIERCIQEGARKNKLGKDFAAAVLCVDEFYAIDHELKGSTSAEIYADPRYQLRKGVRVQMARIIRIRPMIPTGWSCTFTLEYDDDIVSLDQVKKAMLEAGNRVGMGDWRPKFGRFIVEVA